MTAASEYPFDRSGIQRGSDGIARYTGRPASLVHMLRASVDADPQAPAVGELGGAQLSYGQLWDAAARVAGGLREAGVRRGDRVAIRLPNGLDWVLAFLGSQLAGAVSVPVNTRLTDDEVRYVVTDAGAAVTLDSGLPTGRPYADEQLTGTDLAAIFYTSGTTGFPKGAMTSHENFLANSESCRRAIGIDRGARMRTLVSVPLFHVTGCNSQLLTALDLGGATVVMPSFEVGAFLAAIPAERIDTLTSVPAIYWLALHQPGFDGVDVSGVRFLSYGGAPIAPELVHRLQQAFPAARVGNGFGLTETASLSTYLPHEYAAEHADSVGFPVPVVDVELADWDRTTGVGELLIRGPNVVAGYWGRPEATAQTFTDGWLHTGDLADISAEGLIRIVDRAKDMINRGGENVYCVEVENVLAGAPGVFEVAVVGIPDRVLGEKVAAVVVPLPGSAFDSDAFLSYARGRLADYKVPQFLALRATPLPRNPGGKILKPELRTGTDWGVPLR